MFKYLVITSLLISVFTSCGGSSNSSSVVFMNNVKVFESFEMKKDYDEKLQQDLLSESSLLDSIELKANQFLQDSLETFRLRNQYLQVQQVYNQKFEKFSAQYTTEVNNRLNEYIEAYAKEKGYEIVLGSGGEGNVMYVKEGLDITEDLITFINKSYNE